MAKNTKQKRAAIRAQVSRLVDETERMGGFIVSGELKEAMRVFMVDTALGRGDIKTPNSYRIVMNVLHDARPELRDKIFSDFKAMGGQSINFTPAAADRVNKTASEFLETFHKQNFGV